ASRPHRALRVHGDRPARRLPRLELQPARRALLRPRTRAVGPRLAAGLPTPGRAARCQHLPAARAGRGPRRDRAEACPDRARRHLRAHRTLTRAARMSFSQPALLVAAALAAPLAAAAAPFAYVPNEGSGTLSVIDTASDR